MDRRPMRVDGIPLVVLAGSDGRASELPEAGRDKHALAGYKGVDLRFDGRPIVELIVERIEASGRFGEVFVAGPVSIYGTLRTAARLVDTDGTFAGNIRASIEAVRARHPGRPIAFITCDVLPSVSDLRLLFEDYARYAPCNLWFPVVQVPEDRGRLGASSWKPVYRVAPRAGDPAVPILGGHLVFVDPEALRLDFLYRLFDLAYDSRNRPVDERRRIVVRGLAGELLSRDLSRLRGFRPPSFSWKVLRAGFAAARQLRDGTVTCERLESALDTILVRDEHRRKHPHRRVRIPIVGALSIALDIDTEEEAREVGGEVSSA